jgi:hypothetical protein
MADKDKVDLKRSDSWVNSILVEKTQEDKVSLHLSEVIERADYDLLTMQEAILGYFADLLKIFSPSRLSQSFRLILSSDSTKKESIQN